MILWDALVVLGVIGGIGWLQEFLRDLWRVYNEIREEHLWP